MYGKHATARYGAAAVWGHIRQLENMQRTVGLPAWRMVSSFRIEDCVSFLTRQACVSFHINACMYASTISICPCRPPTCMWRKLCQEILLRQIIYGRLGGVMENVFSTAGGVIALQDRDTGELKG